jgi:hypothetical protein
VDPVRNADYHYFGETAVYEALSQAVNPRYYGSYTCKLTIPLNKTRSVRLILIKYVVGVCMRDLWAFRNVSGKHLEENCRCRILYVHK